MNPVPSPLTFSARLAAIAQRFGIGGRAPRQVLERASRLQLPFQPLPVPPASIWWERGAPLHRLVDLPRDALSGPVQDDKQAARAALMGVVETHRRCLSRFDLREVDGLSGDDPDTGACARFEDYVAHLPHRRVRIISYKDFVKAIGLALPRFPAVEPVALRQASWRGERLYWAGEQHVEAFASAIAYARFRGLELVAPAELTHYRLSEDGVRALDRRYHVLAMPHQAWNDPAFMRLLLDTGMPYARLSLLRAAASPEFLLLPKEDAQATALGAGLRLAGAPDVVAYLRALENSGEDPRRSR
ncbi:DUF6685 family protein [Pseudomonas sp. RIT-PI-AD]|uniref:DUF6685 family protein n=1 Tax=Pseudomonas sp. RIT-PI-AD TaxID=3035294 RepID=UPI0021D8C346|nr:DUF6685 family protein [Pseudomonas sp. RIT-PI-AD]